MRIETREQLQAIRKEAKAKIDATPIRILICAGTGCISGGSQFIYDKMKELVGDNENVEVKFEGHVPHPEVKKSGCHGFCEMGPLMRIEPLNILYVKVQPEDCEEIYNETIKNRKVIDRLVYKQNGQSYVSQESIPFYEKQTRIVLKNCGHIDAEHIEEYIAVGGYEGLEKVLFDMTKEEGLDEILKSGLRGRGGAGFPTGKKWAEVAKQPVTERYVVCNGDEGDPGAFMDRSIMEGDPHKMIEGMMIGAYLVGAQNGYIYVRAEYPLAVERLRIAIAQAEERGLLGDNILGTDFSFRLHINRGAGAFVCGEGSALTASIEGNRGMPRVKPPRSAEKGLFERPTVLNNVETYANVPMIIANGSDWYRGFGTEGSPGTKAFALTGSVNNTGLIEVPMGTTLREIVYDIGGGVKDNVPFKAVQIGGPSGGCIPASLIDTPVDYENINKTGAIVGSGGMIVMDETTCMVDMARYFLDFTRKESCGKCNYCRIGTKRMLEILERITNGQGKDGDIELLEELAYKVKDGAMCGLGQTAPNPVITTLKYFRHEYEDHIYNKKCTAKACKSLISYDIVEDKCKGCGACKKKCPVSAISGNKKEAHVIDKNICIKCGKCMETCKFNAIEIN